jgi:hypothetical protein
MPRAQLGYFYPLSRPADPGYGIPGYAPGQGLPGDQPYPDQGLPGGEDHPSNELPPGSNSPIVPGTPEHPIAAPPGTIWPPLPPNIAPGIVWAYVWIRGHGHKWITLDLKPDQGLPPPMVPQPKR